MLPMGSPSGGRTSPSCGVLLGELQQLWSDIGESEADKDRMLLELEKELLEVYRRKVHEAADTKARLQQSLVAWEAELATLRAVLGELNPQFLIQTDKKTTLKEQLASIMPTVEDLKLKKEERIKEFFEIKAQIERISGEISGYSHLLNAVGSLNLEEQDLSLRKLAEYQTHLHNLQKEKSERLCKVLEYVSEVHSLCGVLGLDFGKTVSDVHPSLQATRLEQSTNISDGTLESLQQAILWLKTERKVRFQKLKDILASLFELWNLMGSTKEERSSFSKITSAVGSSEVEIVEPGVLSTEILEKASTEVERLAKLKASRMKELVMKKRSELEDICSKTHIEPDPSTDAEKSNAMIDSGLVDPCELLVNIEAQINKAKAETVSRKEIMDRIERWLSACDEEKWLHDYNQDESRYSAGRGVHINLKRAERARVTVNKIPAMVDNLINKTLAWEDEKKKLFLYDGVHLVSILDDYKLSRQQKEDDKKRYRDQKKLQDVMLREKEAMYGSKPSPRRINSFRKVAGFGSNRNGSMISTPRRNSIGSQTPELLTPRSYSGRQSGYFKEIKRLSTGPLNFMVTREEDTMSFSTVCASEPASPPKA